MKTVINMMVLLLLLSSGCSAASKQEIIKQNENKYYTIVILENGVIRKKNILKDKNAKSGFNAYSADHLDSKEGIIIKFKNSSKVSINEFEIKYSLKLKEKLVIGYYIFSNESSSSDIEIVSQIINNESNIKTVKPNWKMKNIIYWFILGVLAASVLVSCTNGVLCFTNNKMVSRTTT